MKKIFILLSLVAMISYTNELNLHLTNTTHKSVNADSAKLFVTLKVKDRNLKKASESIKNKSKLFTNEIQNSNLATVNIADYNYSKNNVVTKNKEVKYKTSIVFASNEMSKFADSSYVTTKNNKNVYNLVFSEISENIVSNLEKIYKRVSKVSNHLSFVSAKTIQIDDNVTEKEYTISQTFLIDLSNIKNISKVVSIAKKYEMEVDNPDFYVKNIEYNTLDEINKSKNIAKIISKKLGYNLKDEYILNFIKSSNNSNYIRQDYKSKPMNLSIEKMETDIQSPNMEETITSSTSFKAYNDSKLNLKNNITLEINASVEAKDKLAKISISVDDDKKVSKLKSILNKIGILHKLSTKTYYSSSVEKEIPVYNKEQYISFMVNLLNIDKNNFRYILNKYPDINGNKIEIKADTYEKAMQIFKNIETDLKKHGVAVNVDSYENISKEILVSNKKVKENILNHNLEIETQDLKNTGLIISICQELGINISHITFEADKEQLEESLYTKAIEKFKDEIKSFGKYEVQSIVQDNVDNDYSYEYYPNMNNNKKELPKISDEKIIENAITNYIYVPNRTLKIYKNLTIKAKVEK
ncbi:hypothetical protein [Caviibacter abscessus]|uniref:hypothetical protein n=1 Tax=Caviibacter abscessus TaxID=1766719 RepID=UPI00083777CF|nr:hypothetical protein [Caviibacter abscessus]